MSAKKSLDSLRTWVEIDRRALARNIGIFRKLIGPQVKLWAVVKSNAYGHGLVVFSKLAEMLRVDGFCVDSCVEGFRLREEGITRPVLVLGTTLRPVMADAVKAHLTLTVSNFDALDAILRERAVPKYHIKIDTGMHRQGFYLEDIPKVIIKIKRAGEKATGALTGVYTHFSSAKDMGYPAYTDLQFSKFEKAKKIFVREGFSGVTFHAAATGGVLMHQIYHMDAVRVGIGLYGIWPSKELELQLPKIKLSPVLSWRAVAAEVKMLKAGDYIGYDLAERVARPTKSVVLPVGYWHGFPRSLSGIGEVLIRGKHARVLGRVSMDMISVDVTGSAAHALDRATLIGRDGQAAILASRLAERAGTSTYELVTRLNPLMERIVV